MSTEWIKIRDALREALGWSEIDKVVLEFFYYAVEIEKLRLQQLSDETYNILTTTWGRACTLAISEVVSANPHIRQLRDDITKRLIEQELARVRS